MIAELWDYFTTSANRKARSEGYLYHSIALAHRARRCQRHWQPHLKNCYSVIEKLPEDEKCAVLGSGLLMETPIHLLLEKYSRVDLYDVVHPKQVHADLARHPKRHRIRFHQVDVNRKSLKEMQTLLQPYDSVISANLLSQLPYVISQNLRKAGANDQEISKQAFELQKKHCDLFRSLGTRGLLFSDFEMQIIDATGRLLEETLTVDKNIPIHWKSPWTWRLAPAPELSRDYSVNLKVGVARWE